jgi:prevent-host-death family protein
MSSGLTRGIDDSPPLCRAPPADPADPADRSFCVFFESCYNVATLLHQELIGMAITKLSSREFNQDTSRAKRAAKRGPVFITNRGRPSHVLLTAEEYQRIAGGQKSIVDLLAMPEAAEIEFEPPRLAGHLHEPADLS